MKTIEHIHDFIEAFVRWASIQPDIHAVGLVGSYARAAAREDSDIDLVILAELPSKYLAETAWIKQFGQVEKYQIEDYGKLTSLRVWYSVFISVHLWLIPARNGRTETIKGICRRPILAG